MNGPHDLGGTDGFGPVPFTPDSAEPPFQKTWEGRLYALVGAGMMHGLYASPSFRHAIERIEPARYMSSSYFERWAIALSTKLVEAGVISADELDQAAGAAVPLSRPVRAPKLDDPGPDVTEPRYRVGNVVRVRNDHPLGHTRCPRYVRGRRGSVVRSDGPANLDDVEAHSDHRRREPVYCIRFDGAELWGKGAEPGMSVAVDLFESYLEAP